MTVSGFLDVDANNPERLLASLDRRATTVLYREYREALVAVIASTLGTVVDVGAGAGHLVERLQAELPGRPVVGVDPSHVLSRAALAAGRTVVLGSGARLPFPAESAGCLVAERVLQHVVDLEDTLSEMARVAAPNGVLVIADPDHAGVRLAVPGLQDLSDRLVRWRATAGTAAPDAAVRARTWFTENDWHVTQRVFNCTTGCYADARPITNFPEWATLAKTAGQPVTDADVSAWDAHWRDLEARGATAEEWFHWPIVLTTARRN